MHVRPGISGQTARYGYGPLTLAAIKGFTEIGLILLKHGANVEERAANGMTPIMAACSQGSLAMVTLLQGHGAMINVKNNIGETPLYCACSFGCCDVVQFLLRHGASVRKTTQDGDTALHVACIRGHVDVAEILLKNQANVNKAGQFQRSPLHCATLRNNKALIKLLIAFGADTELRDVYGNTATDLLASDAQRLRGGELRGPLTPPVPRAARLGTQRRSQSLEDLNQQFIPSELANSVATINKFMRLCKKQFPLARGLEQITFKTEIFAPQAPGFLQILSKDTNQSQWILISTIDCSGAIVRVYDPLSKIPHSHEAKCKIASQIRYTNVDRGHLVVQVMSVKQAQSNHDTGPLVMAYATDILLNRDATEVSYSETTALRKHLKECFRSKMMTAFPRQPQAKRSVMTPISSRLRTVSRPQQLPRNSISVLSHTRNRAVRSSSISAWYKMELFCICHLPYDNDMVKCSGCSRFFHPSCLYGNISIPEDANGTRYLQCFECSPHSQKHLTPIHQPNLNNSNLQYDLFVSYSYADIRFVRGTLMRKLDRRDGSGNHDLMICGRDWPIGGPIIDTIVEKMEQSVKAVAIISKGFLRGAYTHYEWQMMVHCKPYASAVILLDPPDSLEMSGYLRTLLASRMYLEWSDDPRRQQVFWQKLKRFLGTPLHVLRDEMAPPQDD